MSAFSTGDVTSQHSVVASVLSLPMGWGGCLQGGQPVLSKLPYSFFLYYLKSFHLALKWGRWCLLPWDVLSMGRGARPIQLNTAFVPWLPKSHPPMLVPILHTIQATKAKQITAVTYFQPPSTRKMSHQKLSMSPVQPWKSKQGRNVRCQNSTWVALNVCEWSTGTWVNWAH